MVQFDHLLTYTKTLSYKSPLTSLYNGVESFSANAFNHHRIALQMNIQNEYIYMAIFRLHHPITDSYIEYYVIALCLFASIALHPFSKVRFRLFVCLSSVFECAAHPGYLLVVAPRLDNGLEIMI